MTAAPHVWSVVLAFNNFRDTDECIASLVAQSHAPHTVLVVDNGSFDDSLGRLRERWRDTVSFLETGANLGVAGGYNAGIRHALDRRADFIALCNNDIVVDPDFLTSLLGVFEARRRAAIAVPLMLYFDRPHLTWFVRSTIQPLLCLSRNEGRGTPLERARRRIGAIYASDYVPTCASLVSREAFARVGLLDERFFFGHDDVDWCLRARALGLECVVLGRPLVRHKVSVTSGRRGSDALNPRTAYTYGAGAVLVGARHFAGWKAPGFLLALVALRIPYNTFVLARARRWRSVPSYLRGLADGLRRHGRAFFDGSERQARPA